MIKPLVAGNWKMNGLKASMSELNVMAQGYDAELQSNVDLAICPPAPLLISMAAIADGTNIGLGGQDCHANVGGAHTGDVSAEMIKDAGATFVVVGHSERRADHGESDAVIKQKAEAGLRASLTAIICVGETREERDSGKAVEVVVSQLKGSMADGASAENVVIAYEPVWAIGTGLTPTAKDVEEMHGAIRAHLISELGDAGANMRILYGGSVKPANASELMAVANVNGALVGGASLKAEDFLGIAAGYR